VVNRYTRPVSRRLVRPTQVLGDDFRSLGELSSRVLSYNIAYITLAWGIVLGAFALAVAYPNPFVIIAAALVVSGRQQALLNIEHECIHALFVKGRKANDFVAIWLCASPAGSPFWAARARHLSHHKYLGTPEDPDGPLHTGPAFATRRSTMKTFILGTCGGYALKVLFGESDAVNVDPKQARADKIHLVVTQVVLWAATAWLFAWWVWPVLWLIPLATVGVLAHQIRSFGEHAITPSEEDPYGDRLISTTSNPVERYMVAPFFMNFHSEHHLFPWVPAKRLPEVQRRLDLSNEGPVRLRRKSYLSSVRHYLAGIES